eukprot:1410317-Pyramimonas_sp.AAC.1
MADSQDSAKKGAPRGEGFKDAAALKDVLVKYVLSPDTLWTQLPLLARCFGPDGPLPILRSRRGRG